MVHLNQCHEYSYMHRRHAIEFFFYYHLAGLILFGYTLPASEYSKRLPVFLADRLKPNDVQVSSVRRWSRKSAMRQAHKNILLVLITARDVLVLGVTPQGAVCGILQIVALWQVRTPDAPLEYYGANLI